MKYSKKLLAIAFAAVMLIGSAAVSTQAQRRGGRVIYRRPVVVRPHYYGGYHRSWNSFYNPYFGDPYFGDSYFYDPYLRERQQGAYLRNELRGNQKELRKHLEKYNADGVITEKERRELADDYRDVTRAKRNLNEFNSDR